MGRPSQHATCGHRGLAHRLRREKVGLKCVYSITIPSRNKKWMSSTHHNGGLTLSVYLSRDFGSGLFVSRKQCCCSAAVSAMAARNGAARWAFALTRRNFLDGLSSGRTWHGDSNIERPASPRPSHLTTLFLGCESKSRPRRARTSCDPPLFDMALSFA